MVVNKFIPLSNEIDFPFGESGPCHSNVRIEYQIICFPSGYKYCKMLYKCMVE
jgi:hypothetical protein